MKIRRDIIIVFLIALAACCGTPAARGQPQPPDDLTADGNLMPVNWRPVIWSFFIRSDDKGGERLKAEMKAEKVRESTTADLGAWGSLQPQIQVRRRAADQRAATQDQVARLKAEVNSVRDAFNQERDPARHRQLEAQLQLIQDRVTTLEKQLQAGTFAAFGPDEHVPSGWRRGPDANTPEVKLSGDGFNAPVTAEEAGERAELVGKPHPVDQFDAQSPVYLFFEPDILMTADVPFKDTVLKREFRVVKLLITAHPVPKEASDPDEPTSPARVRNFPAETDGVIAVHSLNPAGELDHAALWDAFPFSGGKPLVFEFKLPGADEKKATPGVWEFRIVATVRGRLNVEDPLQTMNVEGGIRAAFVKEKGFHADLGKDAK